MRFKTFHEAVQAASDQVKGQSNIQVVTDNGEVAIEHVLVQDGGLLLVTKGADIVE